MPGTGYWLMSLNEKLPSSGISVDSPPPGSIHCVICGRDLQSDTVHWHVASDDVSQWPFCWYCDKGGFWQRWGGLSRIQRVFFAGFLCVLFLLISLLARYWLFPPTSGANELLIKAKTLFSDGKREEALDCLKNGLALKPNDVDACLDLGRIQLYFLNDPASAILCFERALELSPHETQARLLITRASMVMGNDSLALDYLQQIYSTNQTMDALYFQASILMRKGQLEAASQIFRTMTILNPQNPTGWFLLAQLLLELGKPPEEIEPLVQQALVVAPENPFTHYFLGKVFLKRRFLQPAQNSFAKAHRLAPKHNLFLLSLVDAYLADGRRTEALEVLSKPRTPRPGEVSLLIRHAEVITSLGKTKEGEALLEDAGKRFPSHPLLLLTQAQKAMEKDDFHSAESLLNRALALPTDHPWRSQARSLLIEVHVLCRKPASASELLEQEMTQKRVVSHAQESQVVRAFQQSVSSGALRITEAPPIEESSSMESMPMLAEVFLSSPVSGTASSALHIGIIQASHAGRKRDWTEVLAALDTIASFADRLPAIHYQRAVAFEGLGRYLDAVKSYEKTLAVKPDYWRAANNLAYLLTDRLRETGKAKKILDRLPPEIRELPHVADTIAWNYILSGRESLGIAILEPLVGKLPNIGELRFHLAYGLAAVDKIGRAKTEALSALRLSPNLQQHPTFKELTYRLGLSEK
jgi:tetratricopeptide (TPR) repeat protein